MAIIWGIFIPYHFPIIANIDNFLNEHGGVRGEARFPPNAAIIWGIFIPYYFPIIANIGNFLNKHGGLQEHGGVRGDARFPPFAIMWQRRGGFIIQ